MSRLMPALAAALVALPFTAAADETRQGVARDSVIEAVIDRGALKVGLSEFEPWTMRDIDGELIGFEPDVSGALAEDMGVELELYPTPWDGIIPALLSGKFDVIISGMSVTSERNLKVNFSVPYARSGQRMLANRRLGEGMSVEDFNSPSVTFGARRGAVAVEAIREAFPQAELLLFDDEPTLVREVVNGNVHAMMSAEPLPSREIAKNPEALYRPTDRYFAGSVEAFALRKGDPDALNLFNNWIADRSRSGWLRERHDYWFVGNEWEGRVAR